MLSFAHQIEAIKVLSNNAVGLQEDHVLMAQPTSFRSLNIAVQACGSTATLLSHYHYRGVSERGTRDCSRVAADHKTSSRSRFNLATALYNYAKRPLCQVSKRDRDGPLCQIHNRLCQTILVVSRHATRPETAHRELSPVRISQVHKLGSFQTYSLQLERQQQTPAMCSRADDSWTFYSAFAVSRSSRSPESRIVFPSGSLIIAKYIPKEVA